MLDDDARRAATTSSTSTQEPEDAYAEHCREADIATAPLRDCLSYYNGHGDAEPGSLAYYGGGGWHRWRKRGPGDARAVRLPEPALTESSVPVACQVR